MRAKFHIVFLFAFLLGFSNLQAQTVESNLDAFFKLLKNESEQTAAQKKKFVIIESDKYAPLKAYVNNLKTCVNCSDSLKAVIDSAFVNYSKIYRDGFFGDYFLVRNITIELRDTQNQLIRLFSCDTVLADYHHKIETPSLPFTQSDLPPEPFWQSVIEPVVIIVTVSAVVLGLFYGRSK